MDDHLNTRFAGMAAREEVPSISPVIERNFLLNVLWRRKWLIAATVLGITLLAAVITQIVPPRYTAALKLAFETRGQSVAELDRTTPRAPQDETGVLAGIMNEIEILKSHELAEKVIDKLRLDENPEFNPALAQGGLGRLQVMPWLSQYLPRGWLKPKRTLSAGEMAARQRSQIVKRFLSRLDVKLVGRSNVFDVAFTSSDAALAAEIANTLGETYLVSRYEDRLANARRASEWLASNVQQLRDKVAEAERSVESYRREHNLFQADKTSLVSAQISELNLKLIDASAERAEVEADVAQARRLTRNSDDLAALEQILHSELIQRFRGEQLTLDKREAEMKEKYGPRHPMMIQIAAEKQRLSETIDSEVKKIVRSLESKAQASRIREAALSKDLNALKRQSLEANTASIALRGLERDAEANRLLLERFMAAFIESNAREDARSVAAYARIISRAPIPDEASFPKPAMVIALACLAGIIISLPLAFGVEALDAGYRSAHQVELDLGLPVLAHVPASRGWRREKQQRRELPSQILDEPASIYSDAVRSICNKLLMSSFGSLPRSVLFTSAEPDEGKTTTVLSLVRLLANTGRKVLLIDGDLHRSRVAETLQISMRPGLAELLSKSVPLEKVIQRDPRTSADCIVSGQRRLDASDLLTTPVFSETLRRLEEHYETIIIDAPPVMALTDALALANAAAATVMVVKWGATRREVVKYAAMQLATAAKRFEGVVLTKVQLKSNARYGYGDAARYSARLGKYFRA